MLRGWDRDPAVHQADQFRMRTSLQLSQPAGPQAGLQLTESLHLKDTDWHFVFVNPEQKGTWHRIRWFELQEKKIQEMPPWKYLGLEIGNRTIVPQKLKINPKIKTLVDVHKLCGSLNWVWPWLSLTNKDLNPIFNLLKGGEDPGAPRSITPEARKALEKVQIAMSTRQANRCQPDLPFKFIILDPAVRVQSRDTMT